MRLMVFFDLPTNTKKQRHQASKFRNTLLKYGFTMMQYSIYVRVCKGQDKIDKQLQKIRDHIPDYGNIRAMQITNKQFEKIEIILGKNKEHEEKAHKQLLLF